MCHVIISQEIFLIKDIYEVQKEILLYMSEYFDTLNVSIEEQVCVSRILKETHTILNAYQRTM